MTPWDVWSVLIFGDIISSLTVLVSKCHNGGVVSLFIYPVALFTPRMCFECPSVILGYLGLTHFRGTFSAFDVLIMSFEFPIMLYGSAMSYLCTLLSCKWVRLLLEILYLSYSIENINKASRNSNWWGWMEVSV